MPQARLLHYRAVNPITARSPNTARQRTTIFSPGIFDITPGWREMLSLLRQM
jgi:hypothetical protein